MLAAQKAVGISDIVTLTKSIEDKINKTDFKKDYSSVKKGLAGTPTIEDILNQIRLIRQITNEEKSRKFRRCQR